MSECCRFCDAEPEAARPDGWFECGTRQDYSERGNDCRFAAAFRYEELFQIAPWDDGPITREVCQMLGLVPNGRATRWNDFRNSPVIVRFLPGSDTGDVGDRIATAGQLALELALKRSTHANL